VSSSDSNLTWHHIVLASDISRLFIKNWVFCITFAWPTVGSHKTLFFFNKKRNRGSSVGIASCRLPRDSAYSPVRSKKRFFSVASRPDLGSVEPLSEEVLRFPPVIKMPGREASFEGSSELICTSNLSCAFMRWSIQHRIIILYLCNLCKSLLKHFTPPPPLAFEQLDHRRNTVITNELTNFMEQSPFWESYSSLASLEITFSGNGMLIAETHPVHVLPPFLVKLHFDIILHSTSGSSKWPLSFSFPNQNPVCTSPLPHTCYLPRPSHSFLFDDANNVCCGVPITSPSLCCLLQSPVEV
jgi:hypothetical protein